MLGESYDEARRIYDEAVSQIKAKYEELKKSLGKRKIEEAKKRRLEATDEEAAAKKQRLELEKNEKAWEQLLNADDSSSAPPA